MNEILKHIETEILPAGKLRVYFLGQAGYVLKTPVSVIYIDPYLTDYVEHPEGLKLAAMKRLYPPPIDPDSISKLDAVIATHGHADHLDPWTINSIKPEFRLYCTGSAYTDNQKLLNLALDRVTFIDSESQYQIGDLELSAVPAAHYELLDPVTGKPISVSLRIKVGSKVLFFWGDGVIYAGLVEKLRETPYDLFFAPVNGRDWFREQADIIGNLNLRELVELSRLLKIGTVVPNHFDLFRLNGCNPRHFIDHLEDFNPGQDYRVLSHGEYIEV